MAVAGDVPNKFDCVINGEGYLVADVEDVKAVYGFTPTFVTRQNVQGDYGDQFQDFWLTASQNDWSLGEDQRFFRTEETSRRRFWRGSNVEVRAEGQVSMRPQAKALTLTGAATSAIAKPAGSGAFYQTSSTNLYEISSTGTITDNGAHGLGGSPLVFAIASDGANVLFSGGGGTVVRRWSGAAFSTFSATPAIALAWLNNTLYGLSGTSTLIRYDTAGTATTIFSWLTATGAAAGTASPQTKLIPFGGKLLIVRALTGVPESRTELWIYDGVGVSLLHAFEENFSFTDAIVAHGTVFVAGGFLEQGANRQTILYFANGQEGVLWETVPGTNGAGGPGIAAYAGGLVWHDTGATQYMFYTPSTGGIHRIASYGVSLQATIVSGINNFFSFRPSSATADLFPDSTTRPTSSTVTTSLFDFDSSLDKLFRGIKVDFDSATTGDGGTVDISYRIGDVTGSFTSLQTGATSGTEYLLTNITGRSITVKVTLNKGTSTAGPVLKRVSVRGVPKQFNFRKDTFVLNLTGRDGEQPITLRDWTSWSQDGLAMATTLRTIATTQTPVSITDEFGTFTGIIENEGFQIKRVRPNEFIAVVPVREV